MKKIIILGIATLSTGIVLSSNMKKAEVVTKPVSLNIQKNIVQAKNASAPSFDVVATAAD